MKDSFKKCIILLRPYISGNVLKYILETSIWKDTWINQYIISVKSKTWLMTDDKANAFTVRNSYLSCS